MEERELTNRQLSILVGTEASTVSRWRRGLTPNAEYRKKIARKLKLTEAELKRLGWEELANV